MSEVFIDNLNIHMPDDWSGDAVYLARSVAEQIQENSKYLISGKDITIEIGGDFSGLIKTINKKLSQELIKQNSILPEG